MERNKDFLLGRLIVVIIILLTIMSVLSSCGTTKIIEKEVPIETVRTEYKVNTLYDSIYIHDSIDRLIKGDTVFISSFKTRFKYLNKTDTIYKTDSIEKPVYITKTDTKVVNKITPIQKLLIYSGVTAWVLLIIGILHKIKK